MENIAIKPGNLILSYVQFFRLLTTTIERTLDAKLEAVNDRTLLTIGNATCVIEEKPIYSKVSIIKDEQTHEKLTFVVSDADGLVRVLAYETTPADKFIDLLEKTFESDLETPDYIEADSKSLKSYMMNVRVALGMADIIVNMMK